MKTIVKERAKALNKYVKENPAECIAWTVSLMLVILMLSVNAEFTLGIFAMMLLLVVCIVIWDKAKAQLLMIAKVVFGGMILTAMILLVGILPVFIG